MNRTFAAALLLLMAATASMQAQTAASIDSGLTVTSGSVPGSYALNWWGIGGNTYFVRQSPDLHNWTYAPIIESGSDQVISWGFSSNTAAFFSKLEYTSIPATLGAYNTDFIGTGLTAWQLIQNNIDPLSTSDTGNLGILDAWRLYYFGTVSIDPNAPVGWSNGAVSNLQAFQFGLNPIDYYGFVGGNHVVATGDSQVGSPGGYVSLPLTITLSNNSTGFPLVDAPVLFTVPSGGGFLRASSTSALVSSLAVLTNLQGQAQVYYQLPSVSGTTCCIQCWAAGQSGPEFGLHTFTESSDYGGGNYVSPFSPSNVIVTMNADGSIDMTWQNNTDPGDTTPIPIWGLTSSGWSQIATVPAGTTSYHAAR